MDAERKSADYRIQLVQLLRQISNKEATINFLEAVEDMSLEEANNLLMEVGTENKEIFELLAEHKKASN